MPKHPHTYKPLATSICVRYNCMLCGRCEIWRFTSEDPHTRVVQCGHLLVAASTTATEGSIPVTLPATATEYDHAS
jgi:hypothetical protein